MIGVIVTLSKSVWRKKVLFKIREQEIISAREHFLKSESTMYPVVNNKKLMYITREEFFDIYGEE